MTWTQGRRLTAYTYVKNGKTYNVTLTYNADGIRIGKLIQNANDASDITVHGYVLDGTSILRETVLKNHPAFSKSQLKVIRENWEVIKNGIIELFPKR